MSYANAVRGQSRTEFMEVDAELCLVERQDQVILCIDPVRTLISAHQLRCDVIVRANCPYQRLALAKLISKCSPA